MCPSARSCREAPRMPAAFHRDARAGVEPSRVAARDHTPGGPAGSGAGMPSLRPVASFLMDLTQRRFLSSIILLLPPLISIFEPRAANGLELRGGLASVGVVIAV